MAKALFFGVPAYGHVMPSLAVVAELVRRGESVTYYCADEFRPLIERTGAEFREYHPPMDHDAAQAAANSIRLYEALLDGALGLLAGVLEDLERDRPDYVIHDSVCPWGRFAAEILRLPAVASHPIFVVDKALYLPGSPLARLWSALPLVFANLPSLRRIRQARRHLKSVYGITSTRLFDVLSNRAALNIVYTSRTFQPRPDLFGGAYEFVGPSLAPRGDEGNFESELTGAPVYIALGTIFNRQSARFYRCAFEALGGIGRQVVLSAGNSTDIAQLGAIPSNFLVRNWVPQLVVLSRACLFLSRSGMNSVSESMYHGVPMLLFPEILEQRLVAKQVADSGAGVVLEERNLNPDKLRREVNRVLENEEFRQAAERVGATFREAGGYRRAADRILEYRSAAVAR